MIERYEFYLSAAGSVYNPREGTIWTANEECYRNVTEKEGEYWTTVFLKFYYLGEGDCKYLTKSGNIFDPERMVIHHPTGKTIRNVKEEEGRYFKKKMRKIWLK
jgi:hypothetical protein